MPYNEEVELPEVDTAGQAEGTEGAGSEETAGKAAAEAQPDPYLDVLSKYRGTLTPEQLDRAVNQGFFFETEQGRAELKRRAQEMLLNDRDHLKLATERALATDKKIRRFARQFTGSLKPDEQTDQSQSESEEAQPDQMGELREMMLEMKSELEQVRGLASGANTGLGQVTTAAVRTAELQQLAAQDEDVVRAWPWLVPEVNRLMAERPKDFAGPGATIRAAKHALSEHQRRNEMLGIQAPRKGPKLPGNGKAGTVTKTGPAIDPKLTQKIVAAKDWDALGKLHAQWEAANPEQ